MFMFMLFNLKLLILELRFFLVKRSFLLDFSTLQH